MVEIPAALHQLATERGLGACEHRFRRRVTALTVLGVSATAGVALLLLLLSAAPLVILALPFLIAGLLLHRRRGACLYVFGSGVVVVSGWAAPRVLTWAEGGLALDSSYEDFQRAARIMRSRVGQER